MTFFLISIFIIALFSLLLAIYIALPMVFPSVFPAIGSPSDVIGYAQIAIELIGVTALIFTAIEFIKSRQKPDLNLWLKPVSDNNSKHQPTKISNISSFHSGYGPNKGVLYTFEFKLLLGNSGDAAAKYVKVIMSLGARSGEPTPGYRGLHFRRKSVEPGDHWAPAMVNLDKQTHVFNGGVDFIAYSHGDNPMRNPDLLDELGLFEVEVPAAFGDTSKIIQEIDISLFANGMKLKKEKLYLHVIKGDHFSKRSA